MTTIEMAPQGAGSAAPAVCEPVELARNRLREVVLLCALPVHQAVNVFAAADMLARAIAGERAKAGAP